MWIDKMCCFRFHCTVKRFPDTDRHRKRERINREPYLVWVHGEIPWELEMNHIPHWSHLYGRSLVWVRMCLVSRCRDTVLYSQNWHCHSFSFVIFCAVTVLLSYGGMIRGFETGPALLGNLGDCVRSHRWASMHFVSDLRESGDWWTSHFDLQSRHLRPRWIPIWDVKRLSFLKTKSQISHLNAMINENDGGVSGI